MSQSVDTRVVQLDFDNADFKAKVKDTLSELAQMGEMLSKGVDVKGIQNAAAVSNNMKLDGISTAIDQVNQKFSLMGVMALNVFNRISNAAIDLGNKLVHAFAIDPVKQGFEEYELKMGSVQTMMNSSGESLETVNGYLADLNTYADKTIYSFSDMTQNIGKFTNAGVSLNSAVAAIQGISNEAAISGANTNEASRAMYNFAQALSAGSVKLIDWKSIELANMGTADFKQQLIDTAVAMGTLTKTEEGYVSTTTDANGKVSDAFTATKMFNDSLNHQWMTTDVLVETLSHYSTDIREMSKEEVKAYEEKLKGLGYTKEQIKAIEELGMKAFDSAQEVKTFSQLMDTLKEAVGSGWAQTFELIFGDFNEAKQLWTAVNNVLSGLIDTTSSYRNEMLQYWHDTGGRMFVLEGLANLFNLLKTAIEPVRRAFDEVFGMSARDAGRNLSILSEHFKQWTESLSISAPVLTGIREFFTGFFNVLKSIGTVLGGVFGGLMKAVGPLFGLIGDILGTGGSLIGRFMTELSGTGDIAGFIAGKFEDLGGTIGDFISNLRGGVPTIGDFDGVLSSLKEKLDFVGNGIKEFAKGLGSGVLDVINELKPGISEFLSNLGLGDLFAMWNAQGAVAIASSLLAIKKSLDDFLGEESWIKDGFNSIKEVMNGFHDTLVAYQTSLNAKTLLAIGLAVAALAVGMAILARVDAPSLMKAGVAVGVLMNALVLAMTTLSKQAKNAKAVAVMGPSMIMFAGAVLILAAALGILGSMDVETLAKGGITIAAMITVLTIALTQLSKASAKIILGAAALAIAASGILLISGALAVLAMIPAENLQNALVSLGIGLVELAIALNVMQTGIKGAAALTIAAAGILLLTPALVALSAIPIENICNALVMLGGALVVIGLAAAMFEPVIIPMMGLGVALALIGAGVAAAGAGLFLLATAFNLIAVTGAGAAYAVTEVLKAIVNGLAETIPQVAAKMAEGFTMFVETLSANAGRIVSAATELGLKLIEGFRTTIPAMVEAAWDIIDHFCQSVSDHLPSIIESGISMVTSVIQGLTQGLPQIVQAGFELVISFINSMADAIRENHQAMYDAAWNLFTAILEALTDLVGDVLGGLGDLGQQAVDAVSSWWDGLWNAGHDDGEAIKDGVDEGSSGTADTVEQNLDAAEKEVHAATPGMSRAAGGLGDAFLSSAEASIDPFTGEVVSTVSGGIASVKGLSGSAGIAGKSVGSSLGNSATTATGQTASGMRGKVQSAVSSAGKVSSSSEGRGVGSDFGSGMLSGMGSYISSIANKAAEMVRAAKNSAKKEQHSNSPSKDTMRYGRWFGEGYAIGIDRMVGDVVTASSGMAKAAKGELEDSSSYLSSVLDFTSGIDDTPVIRPVLDTSDIQRGMSDIGYLLAQQQVMQAGFVSQKQSLASAASTVLRGESGAPQYNFYLQYDAGSDATEMVRDMTVAVRQSSMSEGA